MKKKNITKLNMAGKTRGRKMQIKFLAHTTHQEEDGND
jgi:hypothetical protein